MCRYAALYVEDSFVYIRRLFTTRDLLSLICELYALHYGSKEKVVFVCRQILMLPLC